MAHALTFGWLAVANSDWLEAACVLSAFWLSAVLVRLAWNRVLGRIVRRTESRLDDILLGAFRGIVVWALVLAGVYYAAQSLTSVREHEVLGPLLGKAFGIAWVMLAVGMAIRTVGDISRWQVEQAAGRGSEAVRDLATRVTFVRKLLTAIALCLGVLYILSAAGIDTSPLIAGGALGGLIIGLALQDSLSNVFAGFFMNIDRPVKIGDLIKLETGEEGFVEDIGWRYTKVRLWANNLVIIPNNKFSQSVIVNYNLPAETLSVYVTCGVSYDSDLDHVERVAIRTAKEVQDSDEGGDKSWDPIVRFKTFGDSAITFVTVLRCVDVGAQYRIHHEFVKRLHKAFRREGIEIPFPIRTVILREGGRPAARAWGVGKPVGSEDAPKAVR